MRSSPRWRGERDRRRSARVSSAGPEPVTRRVIPRPRHRQRRASCASIAPCSAASTSSCGRSPISPARPPSRRPATTYLANARCKARALRGACQAAGAGGRLRPRGRRARRRARACAPRASPPTPWRAAVPVTTVPTSPCCSAACARRPTAAAARAFAASSSSPARTARELIADGTCEGLIAQAPRGERRLRLRPGLPLSAARPHLRRARPPTEKDRVSHRAQRGGAAARALAGVSHPPLNIPGTHDRPTLR